VLPVAGDKNTWVTYYYRGICEERSKQLEQGRGRHAQALDMQPEQPHVPELSRLFLDRPGHHLDEGMKMIKRAVDQRPDGRLYR